MDENQLSQGAYKIENIHLTSLNFSRKDTIDFKNEIKNKIDLVTETGEIDNNEQIIVSVVLTMTAVQKEEDVFTIRIKMTGIFVKDGTPQLPEEVFKKINAPAIIYPFIREQVANTCLKAGLGNIFLPPVNFVERGIDK
jgi:preprotein translocase subunit SecB